MPDGVHANHPDYDAYIVNELELIMEGATGSTDAEKAAKMHDEIVGLIELVKTNITTNSVRSNTKINLLYHPN